MSNEGVVVSFPLNSRRPLAAKESDTVVTIRIADDSFNGTHLHCGAEATFIEGYIDLPGVHALRFSNDSAIVRFCLPLPDGEIYTTCPNPEYPDLVFPYSAVIGRLVQVIADPATGSRFEYLNDDIMSRYDITPKTDLGKLVATLLK